MTRPASFTCPGCDTEYVPGFLGDLDVCNACQQEELEEALRKLRQW